MHACSGHGWEVERLGSSSISREGCVWGGWRTHGVGMLWAEDTCSCAGRALLVGRRRLGDLALQRSLLLRSQDVSNVVWCPSGSGGGVWRSDVVAMVRWASVWVNGVAVLREVVSPRAWMHCRVPVHPRTGGCLVVLESVVPVLPADSEGRWSGGIKLHSFR